MIFDELNETIPYATGGKEKVLEYFPYPHVGILMPGRHAEDTDPVGGDFCVIVHDGLWQMRDHQFTHDDIFRDVELKKSEQLMECYLSIVQGADPEHVYRTITEMPEAGMIVLTFLQAIQCLAVAEHRRYARFEKKYGGRFLPFRFAAGISEGLWTAQDAIDHQRKGRPGVEFLEKEKGIPKLTKELMS